MFRMLFTSKKNKTGQSKLKASACVRSAKFDTREGTPVTRENDWV